jgi:hypothetical protein
MAKWLPAGHATKRDVLEDMIAAVKAKGIHVYSYRMQFAEMAVY